MLESLENYRNSPGGKGSCRIKSLRAELGEEDARILDNALEDTDGFTTNALHRGLRDAGVVLSYHAVYRHRNKICACEANDA